MGKMFLDAKGLALYDQLIKEYVDKGAGAAVDAEASRAQAAEKELLDALVAFSNSTNATLEAHATDLELLNGDADTEGSVAYQVKEAVAAVVDGAPEALDTLKEIASWIEGDETGTAALIDRVAKNEDDIADLQAKDADLKEYIDAQDEMYYNSITSIEDLKIMGLFPVNQAVGQTAVEAIAAVEEGKAVKLSANQTIETNVTIDKSCYIDANGSVFTGVVTVPADADVVIENATFSNPVVVQ